MRISTRFTLDFNEQKTLDAMSKKQRRALYRSGAYMRTHIRRSMRPGGKKYKISAPGKPPRYHSNPLLRDLTEFRVVPSGMYAVVGPELSRKRKSIGSAQTVPQLLEEGGVALYRPWGQATPVRATYRPRPFIAPATPVGARVLAENMERIPLT